MKKFITVCVLVFGSTAFANGGSGAVSAPSTGSATGLSAPSNPSTDSQTGTERAMDQQRMEDRSKLENEKTDSNVVAPHGTEKMEDTEDESK